MINLTDKEKKFFNKTKTEDEFYSHYSKVKEVRNGILPAFLVREVLEIFNTKFPKDHSKD